MDVSDTYLVLTFVGETRILGLNEEDELDEAEIPGFEANAQVWGDMSACNELYLARKSCHRVFVVPPPCRRSGVAQWWTIKSYKSQAPVFV
jgi:hypothetical protein